MKILIINASVRNERSYSRKLTRLFAENWKTKFPHDTFTYRETGTDTIPNIDESWITGAFKNLKTELKKTRNLYNSAMSWYRNSKNMMYM